MPVAVQASIRLTGFSKTAIDIINVNTAGREGDWGYAVTFRDAIHPPLAHGPQLDAMNRVMLGLLATSMARLRDGPIVKTGLLVWIDEQITLATMGAAYGSSNPYNDPETIRAFK
jgi:hypothetical protein